MRKRKKKHVGEEWAGPSRDELEAAQRHSGIICRQCHKLKRWARLTVSFEKVSKKRFWRTWWCMDCGNAVRIEEINTKKGKVTRVKG
jgi:hypothetical protein